MDVVRRWWFVFVAAAVTVVFSERVFWFWAAAPIGHLEAAAFYSIPVAGTLWAVDRYRAGLGVDGWWPLLLVTPLYGYLVEGVIVPVMYTGGPMVPFFPAYFSFWHGIGAFVFVLVAFRRWLVADAWRPLLAASIALGAFWGLWSTTLWLPENVNDPELIADSGELTVLGPLAFAQYAATFTVVLVAAHWLLGRVWLREFRPGRVEVTVVGVIVAGMLGLWSFSLPWAIPMFAAYVGIQLWALRRFDRGAPSDRRSLLVELHGRVRVRSLWPVLAVAPTAAFVYVAVWQLGPSDLALRVLMYSIVAVQAASGLVLTVIAVVRAGRSAGTVPTSEPSDQALSRS